MSATEQRHVVIVCNQHGPGPQSSARIVCIECETEAAAAHAAEIRELRQRLAKATEIGSELRGEIRAVMAVIDRLVVASPEMLKEQAGKAEKEGGG